MMRLPAFRYVAPTSLDEAARHLAGDPEGTRLVAGGTDLWPNMKRRHQQARTVVGLRRVAGLRGIEADADGGVRIGAMTTLAALCRSAVLRARLPGLVRAAATVSTPVLRNMGTLGGNLCLDTRCTYYDQNEEWRQAIGYCLKECGDTCWVAPGSSRCWAIAAADTAPLLGAAGASVRLVSVRGERWLPLEDLFRDDGVAYLATERDEILAEVRVPAALGLRSTYWKLRRRGSIDFPVLGVGAAVRLDAAGGVAEARIHLGAVSSRPVAATAAAAALRGRPLTEAAIEEAAALAQKEALPMDNTDFEMKWRRHMAGLYVEGALRELAGLPPKVQAPPHGLAALSV